MYDNNQSSNEELDEIDDYEMKNPIVRSSYNDHSNMNEGSNMRGS